MTDKRFVTIGLDGVRLDVVKRFSDDLPVLSRFLSDGVHGNLRSVLPGPQSGPAWTSFATGVNPGKHGIGDLRGVKEGYEFLPTTDDDISRRRFWESLSDEGYTVGVFNFHHTRPDPINGAMVSYHPSSRNQFAYPESFQQQLEDIGYRTTADFHEHTDHLENLLGSIETRRRAMELYMEQYDWNLLAGMFYETEKAHHKYASFLEPDHPLYDENQEAKVKRVYRKIDQEIGKLLEETGDAPVLIASDHGFCPMYERIHVNKILEQYGYYKPPVEDESAGNGDSRSPLNFAVDTLKRSDTARSLVRSAGNVPVARTVVDRLLTSYKNSVSKKRVDANWAETVAFNGLEHGGIYLNTTEDHPEGIVSQSESDELIADIVQDLRDDEYLDSRVRGIHKGEDLFDGDQTDWLPEIVIDFEDGYLGSSGYNERLARDVMELRAEGSFVAYHTMDGVFLGLNDGIRSGERHDPSIMDIAPTVLHYFGLPVPEDTDGNVLGEIFEDTAEFNDRDVTYTSETKRTNHRASVTEEDRGEIEEHLENLGYK